MSLVLGPGILHSSPGAVSFDSNVVNSSDVSDEALFSEVSSPRVSNGPELGTVLDTVSDN